MKRFIVKHKITSVFILLLMTAIMFFAVTLIIHPELISIWQGEFTPEGWNNFPSLRYKIVDDMEEKIDIWNLSKEEIMDMLGPADEEYIDFNGNDISYYQYVIRTRAPILIMSQLEYYSIAIAADGKVEETTILPTS